MNTESEHKPSPWDRVAGENARAACQDQHFRLTGMDPAIDANVVRAIADLSPREVARLGQGLTPEKVRGLVSRPTPPTGERERG